MSAQDRIKWETRYASGQAPTTAEAAIVRMAPLLPRTGTALDVGGGAGRHSVWLASQGLQPTLVDISQNALELARSRAQQLSVRLKTLCADLDATGLPSGPWDVILFAFFLDRALIEEATRQLSPHGVLVILQPTLSNLARHAKPPRDFLLNDGELPQRVAPLEILHYEEGWLESGRHEALLVARQVPSPS